MQVLNDLYGARVLKARVPITKCESTIMCVLFIRSNVVNLKSSKSCEMITQMQCYWISFTTITMHMNICTLQHMPSITRDTLTCGIIFPGREVHCFSAFSITHQFGMKEGSKGQTRCTLFVQIYFNVSSREMFYSMTCSPLQIFTSVVCKWFRTYMIWSVVHETCKSKTI